MMAPTFGDLGEGRKSGPPCVEAGMDLLRRIEAHQKVYYLLGAARHQVSELVRLNCATSVERPVLSRLAVDSAAVSFRCRICLYATSVQQMRAIPSVSNPSQSPWKLGTKQTSDAILLPNKEIFQRGVRSFVPAISLRHLTADSCSR